MKNYIIFLGIRRQGLGRGNIKYRMPYGIQHPHIPTIESTKD
jgi:hypothetical protein